ncbi:hypothetical protein PV327_006278 [Microctonus hyperodae]|uniref:Uncharacterized protein n=1 Tax=Microctonus hyperodae TaxID=165561 RepID=A0AA39KI02_MICHY|nr:hypothetical protein PV327_006278 [Microctonus hyperodae]
MTFKLGYQFSLIGKKCKAISVSFILIYIDLNEHYRVRFTGTKLEVIYFYVAGREEEERTETFDSLVLLPSAFLLNVIEGT